MNLEFLKTEKKVEEKQYKAVIFLMIISVLKYLFYDEKIIGSDVRYNIYIFWLPFLIGILILGFYSRKRLLFVFKSKDSFLYKILNYGLLLLTGAMISIVSTYTLSDFIWQSLHKYKSNNTSIQTKNFEINHFYEKRGTNSHNKIWFVYEESKEYLKTTNSNIQLLKNNPDNYYLEIKLKKGYWNHFIIVDWNLISKQDVS